MTLKAFGFIMMAAVVAGCAKQPDQIAAVDIGTNSYVGRSCPQLGMERTTISQDLANLSAKQKSAASGDAWGVFLLGLPLSSMSGGDQEALIAIAKGKMQAIDRQLVAQRCVSAAVPGTIDAHAAVPKFTFERGTN